MSLVLCTGSVCQAIAHIKSPNRVSKATSTDALNADAPADQKDR